MNPHQNHPTNPIAMFTSLWRNRQLIWQLTRREVLAVIEVPSWGWHGRFLLHC